VFRQLWAAAHQVGKEGVHVAMAAQHRGQGLPAGAGLLGFQGVHDLARGAMKGQHPGAHGLRAHQPMSRRSRWPSASHQAVFSSTAHHLHRHADAHQLSPASRLRPTGAVHLVQEARVADTAGVVGRRAAALVVVQASARR
jgi:hypothetical protein